MEGIAAKMAGVSLQASNEQESQSPLDGVQSKFAEKTVSRVMDDDFTEFPSIFKCSVPSTKKIRSTLADSQIYVVTEKLNGACFSFYTRGEDVRKASRTGFLKKDKDFNNSEIHIGKYCDNVRNLYRNACSDGLCRPGELLTVTGEYYGPAVELGVTIAYPANDFSAFAVSVNSTPLTFDTYRDLATRSGIPVVEEICRGTLDEALAIDPNKLTSKLSGASKESLPVEGVVIQTVDNKSIQFASGQPERLVILKKKAKDFSEGEKQTRQKGRARTKSREAAGLRKQDEAYSMGLAQALKAKLADNPPDTKDLPARISGLLSKGIVKKSEERSDKFFDSIREAVINDAVEEMKNDPEHQELSKELGKVLESTYRKDKLMQMLHRQVNPKKVSDDRLEEIISGVTVKLPN